MDRVQVTQDSFINTEGIRSLCKFLCCLGLFLLQTMENNRTNVCKVCKLDVGGGHKCQECQEIVHLPCGKGVGEEGYGQFVVCGICQIIKARNVPSPQEGET